MGGRLPAWRFLALLAFVLLAELALLIAWRLPLLLDH